VYGAFLLACYDADAEEFQTICKIGTGFSEEALAAHYAALQPLERTAPRGDIKTGAAKPDVWFDPHVVWEVLAADLSLSPVYTAAHGLVRAVHTHTYTARAADARDRSTSAGSRSASRGLSASATTRARTTRRARSRCAAGAAQTRAGG
jgi:ATP-dependent DNA ligase